MTEKHRDKNWSLQRILFTYLESAASCFKTQTFQLVHLSFTFKVFRLHHECLSPWILIATMFLWYFNTSEMIFSTVIWTHLQLSTFIVPIFHLVSNGNLSESWAQYFPHDNNPTDTFQVKALFAYYSNTKNKIKDTCSVKFCCCVCHLRLGGYFKWIQRGRRLRQMKWSQWMRYISFLCVYSKYADVYVTYCHLLSQCCKVELINYGLRPWNTAWDIWQHYI